MVGSTVKIIQGIQDIRQDDIIIAFMGATGVGKSYFIDLLTGQKGARANNGLKSMHVGIQATRVTHPISGRDNIVLVDTPGFDDTTRSDMQILMMISSWLEETYSRDVKLSGLFYLHRITDNRMPGSQLKSLRMFSNLCGDTVMDRVVLISTMWGKVQETIGERREAELKKDFWKPFIDNGSTVERLGTADGEKAWRIVDELIKKSKDREALLLQRELVDLKQNLNETEAGKALHTETQKLLNNQKETLKSLLAQIDGMDDRKLKKDLEKEYKRIQDQFQKSFTENERENLKIPLGRRIWMFFTGKRIRAKSIKPIEAKN